jgi:glutathione S-transferase
MMKLYYSDASPYARIVRVIVRHLDLTQVAEIVANPLENGAELLDANPLAKIPCLVLKDGSALFDSEVIARYLDAEWGDGALFGRASNWPRQCQYSLIKGMLDSAVALRQEQMREQEGLRSAFWTERFEQAILRGLMLVEQQGLLAEEAFSAQQIALVCLLEYLDFRHPALAWRNVAAATAKGLQRFESLPVFTHTRPA